MEELVYVRGIIIKHSPVGDYDLVATIFTAERGKITAFARGARKQSSPFLAGSQPMAFGEFTLYRGRNAYTVTGMKISDYFGEKLSDIEAMYQGMYFLELADYYGREGIEASDTLKLIYLSLKNMSRKIVPDRLIRCIYELRILVINGE